MFRLNTTNQNDVTFYIQDDKVWKQFLHSDGSTYRTVEYFPTREQAQAVLDKFQPKHKWVHGDVFKSFRQPNEPMMYLCAGCDPQVIYFNTAYTRWCSNSIESYLEKGEFLFNIKAFIKDKL